MGRKHRQPDVSEATSIYAKRNEEVQSGAVKITKKCRHVAEAVDLAKLHDIIKNGFQENCDCVLMKGNLDESGKFHKEKVCLACGNLSCTVHSVIHKLSTSGDSHCLTTDIRKRITTCQSCKMDINEKNINSANNVKKLAEAVNLVDKAASVHFLPPKLPTESCQKEEEKVEREKPVPIELPKVGGLANLGNTCFFNAVLQCLAQTPFLVKVLDDLREPGQTFVLQGGKRKGSDDQEIDLPPIEGTLEKWGSFTSVLFKTLTDMQNTNGHQTYKPSELLASFKRKAMQFMDGGQHDSHELLRHSLEVVRNEDLKRYQRVILKEVGFIGKPKPPVDENLLSRVKFYGTQASARLLGPEIVFTGVLVSTLECTECHHTSQSLEPFLDLSLPVMPDKSQPVVKSRNEDSLNTLYADCTVFWQNQVQNQTQSQGQNQSQSQVWNQPQNNMRPGRRASRSNQYNKLCQYYDESTTEPYVDFTTWPLRSLNANACAEESDADVEDNEAGLDRLEVAESGYSSEKPSEVASPVSPANGLALVEETTRESNGADAADNRDERTVGSVASNSPSSTDVSMLDLTQAKRPENLENQENQENHGSLEGSPVNSESLPDLSLAIFNNVDSSVTSVTSVTSPGDITSPDSPIVTKECPASPCSTYAETAEQERPVSRLEVDDFDGREDNESGKEAVDEQLDSNRIQEASAKCRETQNGIEGATAGVLQIDLNNVTNHSPLRYPTKEEEYSIQACLNQFTAMELMSGNNKAGCEACTARQKKAKGDSVKMVYTDSIKQYLIARVPPVLILHLKRFQAQRIGLRKVTKHVAFPILLDLAPACKGRRKPTIYALYGVVEHLGTLHGGHYVAYVKTRPPLSPEDPRWSFLPSRDDKDFKETTSESNSDSESDEPSSVTSVQPPPGQWYYVSDSRVSEVDETTVLQSQAYLLFYERIL